MMVLRFIGSMYSLEPFNISCTIILFAFSDGWKGSQNAYWSLFGHRFEATVHSPRPLYGPCPQQATLDVTKPSERNSVFDQSMNFTVGNSVFFFFPNICKSSLPNARGLRMKLLCISWVLAAMKTSERYLLLSCLSIWRSCGLKSVAACWSSAEHWPFLTPRMASSAGTQPSGPVPVTSTLLAPRLYNFCRCYPGTFINHGLFTC